MKFSIRTLAIALALAPAAAFAQTSAQPVTHAQLMDQLTQLRNDGYVPSNIHYPSDIQAAEARVNASRGGGAMSNAGMGGSAGETVQSGSRMTSNAHWRSMYGGH
ncbi:DUF4148 domain-containing protein [Trinickia sp.]|uniref:DUF4148 domain-containing protein n=1 Tax=Trinickia sp. TaxID=2571163 RepID=UPI003F7EB6FA